MSPEYCQITGLPKAGENPSFKGKPYCYFVKLADRTFPINLTPQCFSKLSDDDEIRKITTSLILNGALKDNTILSVEESRPDISKGENFQQRKNFDEWLKESVWPKTDLEKIDFALEVIQKLIGRMGGFVEFDSSVPWHKMFFCRDLAEFQFVVKTLNSLGLIDLKERPLRPDGEPIKSGRVYPWNVSLTYKGISTLNERRKEIQKDLCFVAMSFSEDHQSIYSLGLAPAIISAGYTPRKVNDSDYHGEEKKGTINDSILALIKKARFVVCDYTGNKNGVYFEHGYAWGLDKKVILTCRKDDFHKAHFDVNHYPFIVWEKESDLTILLRAKIESWIGKFEP